MLTLILVLLALVFAALALFNVPSRVSFPALGVVCLALAMLVPHF